MKTHRVFHFKVLDRLPGVPGHPLRLEQQLADLPGIDEGTGRVLKDGRGDERPEEVGCIGICSKSEDRLRVLDSCSLLAGTDGTKDHALDGSTYNSRSELIVERATRDSNKSILHA